MDSNKASSYSITAPQEASNYDELFMRHSLTFTDNLKELKNLSTHLYSAAEHFELLYCKEERKQQVVETAKEYVTNAIVNTVDHLGSVAFKVTNFLDEKVDEFSGTELQFSCMEQRLQACQEFNNRIGVSQHSLLAKTPTCHKRYIIPGKKDVQAKRVEPNSSLFRKGDSSLQPSSPGTFSFSKIVPDKDLVKRTDSPQDFQLKRSGSLVGNLILSTNSSAKQQHSEELRRSASVSTSRGGRNMTRDIQPYSKKSKPLLKALFFMLKQKREMRLCG